MEILTLTDREFGVSFSDARYAPDGWLDSFLVTIIEPGLEARSRVENSPYIQGPEDFFRSMAIEWRGWKGEKAWRALDCEMELVATTDSLGHVIIEVLLQPSVGPESWRAVSHAHLEAGQLESLANRAAAFFRGKS